MYYSYQQERARDARVAREERRAENAAIRAEKERSQQMKRETARHRAEKTASSQHNEAEPDEEPGETDLELAAREAKERELILAAEELQRLREMQDKADFRKTDDEEEILPEEERAENSVVSALAAFEVFGSKVNKKAEYYIYYCSADWCGHCKKNLPTVKAEYAKMRKKGQVELILISHDKTQIEAKAYAKKSRLNCGAVWAEELKSKMFQSLPGYDAGCIGCSGIPHLYIVRADGTRIVEAHGSFIANWQQYIENDTKGKKTGK